jgi:hypothetical protein
VTQRVSRMRIARATHALLTSAADAKRLATRVS